MIPVPSGVWVWLETGVEYMRRGMSTLALQAQKDFGHNPHEGDFFVFRGRRGDLAAEGRIDAVLVHAPDRLSRCYAYQVVIIEELTRQGVETVFLKAPSMESPKDHLRVQFQGMIAEYEHAQILKRSRRGKRHRALRGEISVLGARPMATATTRKPRTAMPSTKSSNRRRRWFAMSTAITPAIT